MNTRKPLHRPLGDTEYLLEQWGWWRMDGIAVPGYVSPSLQLIRHEIPQPSQTKSYCITDDCALAVDGAVARLSVRDQQMGDIAWLYFGAKWPMIRVGKYYGLSEGKTRELARAAAAWIDCALSTQPEFA
ncbi:antitermination protein Q [Pseudomonas sp. Bc-h]|uniref:antiterminator Q family protein n=1 Tax=Pseudomonas sp. Bc-h TaxID=1943632 RepID=UPI0009D9570D|nr:antiterminator Q family protein [Pseudomonas sp. Bc-h]OQR30275.1 antitermination protein Q [Pseudomonas sp. Bc-h]